MNPKEFAEMLNGRELGSEITPHEEETAKEAGLVVVFGESDDLMESRGALHAEYGAYEGVTVYLTANGFMEYPNCDDYDRVRCPYIIEAMKTAKTIEAKWASGGYSFEYETEIPHETFEIEEDGEKYCKGIVFRLEDLRGEMEK